MNLIYFGQSDIGPKRKINQDCFGKASKDWGSIFVISDGFGHEKGGLFASRYTVDTFIEKYSYEPPKDIKTFFTDTYKQINKYIYYNKVSKYDKAMMGCTTVALIVSGKFVHVAHIGDSRAYLIRNNELLQLTKDHSYIQNLLDSGEVTLEEAKLHPKRNVLSRALGSQKRIVSDYKSIEIIPDDKYVLCTDGVWGFINKESFLQKISDNDPQQAVTQIIDQITQNSGFDNITLQILHFIMF